jgi:hypothetical protein
LSDEVLGINRRVVEAAIKADLVRAEARSTGCVSAPERRAAAGLVPSKTNLDLVINLSAPECAERRIKRLKRSVWASGHLHGLAENGSRPAVPWFVTLTYKGVSDWTAKHIAQAMQAFRNWCQQKGVACRYTWVAELQNRGAVHYHLLAWLPVGLRMPHWDRATRKAKGGERPAFWPHGMTNTEIAKSGVGYLMKYLSKLGELTIFPKGLRLYGIGGLNQIGKNVRRWFNLPEWVKLTYGVDEVLRRAKGFVLQATGEILEPAFAVSRVPGGIVLRALRQLPARFHCGAYSTFPRACGVGA